MEPRRFVVILAFMVLPLASHAQTRILIESRSETEGRGLAGVVERCATLALERAGFEPAFAAGDAAPAASLFCSSSLEGGGFELLLELRSSSEGQALLAEARLAGRLSLDLDERLIEEIAALVAGSGLEPGPRRAPPLATAGAPPAGDSPPGTTTGALAPFALLPGAEALAGDAAALPGASPSTLPAAGGSASPSRLGLDLSSAPVLVVGAAAEYFRFGFDASCSLGYSFRLDAFLLEAGLRAGYALLYSAGQVGGEVHLASLGPELRVRWPVEGRFRALLRLGAGPLYLAVAPEAGESLGKVLPCCAAGLGLEFRPSPGFSLGLEVGILAVFERSFPLVGLAPGLVAAWRL